MSKIAEKKALEAYPPTPLNVSLVDYNSFKRTFYAQGYDQAMQDFMEKACEWLKDNSKKYVVCYEDGYSHYAYNSLIEDLRKAMEENP